MDQQISTSSGVASNGNSWKSDAQSVADAYLEAHSFNEMQAGFSFDLRPLAKSAAKIIQHSATPGEAIESAAAECEKYFSAMRHMQPAYSESLKSRFLQNLSSSITKQAVLPSEKDNHDKNAKTSSKANVIIGSLRETPRSVATAISGISSLFEKKEYAEPGNQTDRDVDRKAAVLCQRYGIRSISIEGDYHLTPSQKIEKLSCLDKDLALSAKMLGIEDQTFGANKLDMRIASSNATKLKGCQDAYFNCADLPGGDYEVSITYSQNIHRQRILNHEYTHFTDLQLGMRALNGEDSEFRLFTQLPPSIQSRLPEAKKALEDMFKLLEGDKDLLQLAEKTAANANKNLVLQVIGREKYFSVTTSQLKELTNVITENNLFLTLAAREIQKGPDWRERTLSHLVHITQENSARAGLGGLDVMERVAELSGLSVDAVQANYIKAIDVLTPDIQNLTPFFSQMNRYVTSPGKMISESALMNIKSCSNGQARYWTEPTEVLARMVGRGSGSWSVAKESVFDTHHGHAFDASKLSILNSCLTKLVKEAGFRTTSLGADLGWKYEIQMERALKAVNAAKTVCDSALDIAKDGAAKATKNVGSRIVSILTDKDKKTLGSSYRPR